ncbi:FAD-dependent oxidoreductase [Massilia sp. TN1-12]|uniref:FAD-dependent oxidoreductase n=1 Tax=Massilia paldalensis TaxID=3377675 RepID=UPI003850F107
MPPHYDVIVAGAGPVGLFLSCELALAGCAVLVLERERDPDTPLKRPPFGLRGLNAPTIAAFGRRGLLDELAMPQPLAHAAGVPGARPGGHVAGIQFSVDDVDPAQWPWRLPDAGAPTRMVDMAALDTVLARRAQALGVTIRRGAAVEGVRQDADGVTVAAGGADFAAYWLVGCDGARSAVRKAIGVGFAGTEPAFTGYTVRVDVADPDKLRPGRNLTAAGMYLQSQPGYLVLQDFDGGAFHDSGERPTRAHVEEVLRRIAGADIAIDALHLATTWTDRARQAVAYRSGRVLLAGDAAHIHSPLGGQGLNLGIGDALNLGWKLAATVRGKAPPGLLDSYHAERHPAGARVLDWSRAQVAAMAPEPGARALHAVLRELLATRDGATYAAGRVWGVLQRYDLNQAHPLAGRGMPAFAFEDGSAIDALMRAGRGFLLDFSGTSSRATLASEYGIAYAAAAAPERLGASCLLVRPDGIVAWASDAPGDCGGLRDAMARWFAA